MAQCSRSAVPDTPEDKLERLRKLARQASPEDRLRLENTIRIIVKARQTVAKVDLSVQKSAERMRRAMASTQLVKAETAQQNAESQTIRDRFLK